jgi:hypothetical protein
MVGAGQGSTPIVVVVVLRVAMQCAHESIDVKRRSALTSRRLGEFSITTTTTKNLTHLQTFAALKQSRGIAIHKPRRSRAGRPVSAQLRGKVSIVAPTGGVAREVSEAVTRDGEMSFLTKHNLW